ncbi:MAG: methylmalonyl Co-A mutase-associated GTPase MeaB [Chloroflexota bacterium]|nr:MAG: methylmalonyl Co-A mutase-associated GTPase MeaB [Chloroflexota bacterium]
MTRPSCAPPAWPGSSGRARRSPRSPSSCAPAPARAPDVAAPGVPAPDHGVPATAVSAHDPLERARELTEAAIGGDRRALARLLTAVENRTPVAEAALRTLYPMAGRAHLVGITGPPGAGKSTLVAALIAEVRAKGRPVGVVAVDPSSPITGGALLGDRVRMQSYASDRDVFIRSMAARGHAGGLASTSAAAAAVLDACGFDLVLLETVGTGQSEVEVAAAADTTVVLEAPEMGDEVQAIKAGLLEVADIVVVNKGDRPGAQRTASQLRAMLVAVARVGTSDRGHHGAAVPSEIDVHDAAGPQAASSPPSDRPRPKQPEVLVTTATTGEGIAELLASLDRHRAAGRGGGASAARLARAEAQVWAILGDRTRAELHAADRRDGTLAVLQAVADHELDPFTAVDRLLTSLRG